MDVDKYAIKHGKMTLIDAGAMLTDIMTGKEMTDMHEIVISGGNALRLTRTTSAMKLRRSSTCPIKWHRQNQ